MNNQNSILKCYQDFNILYLHPSFNRTTRKTVDIEIWYKKHMFHHSTDKFYVFWNCERFVKFLKTRVVSIETV